MPIRVLPQEVASAIAAGEVVERPASVVRELIENALDAGARRIEVRMEGAGQTRIEVADDGVGISAEELSLTVARYATSKLASREDLFAIRTLGFRGEALASIAAVSRFEIVSREADAPKGAALKVEGGQAGRVTARGAPPGTVTTVRDLFFNTPARKKFLKSEATERKRVLDLVGRYAVAYASVAFRLVSENRVSVETAGNGDRREALAAVFDVATARSLIELVPPVEGPVGVSGFVSPPSIHRSNRRDLTFFVNGRWIQDAGLSAAVVQAYHGLLMVGRFPMGFVQIDIDPAEVDVNVHPSKAEVRFRNPDQVLGTVQRTIRATLLSQAAPPEVDLATRWQTESPAVPGSLAWSKVAALEPQAAGGPETPAPRLLGDVPLLRAVGQVGAAYLVAEGPDGLYLIDQHAAHERILFERLREAMSAAAIPMQTLMDLDPIELSRGEVQSLEPLLPSLERIGIQAELFGETAVRVRTLPAVLTDLDPATAVRTALGDFEEDESGLEGEVEVRLAARVCKRGAIRSGQILSLVEQERLVRELESCRSPRTCPHGRPTMIHISVDSLERQFGRRG